MHFLRKMLYRAKNYLYTNEIFYLYKNSIDLKSTPLESNPSINIKKADCENIKDARRFNDDCYIETCLNFMRNGDIGFQLYKDDICVHRAWLQRGPQKIYFFNAFVFNLLRGEFYLHYCKTDESARGMGFYPLVLRHICHEYKETNIYALVLKRKIGACRAMEKGGFEKNKCYILHRILGWVCLREIEI